MTPPGWQGDSTMPLTSGSSTQHSQIKNLSMLSCCTEHAQCVSVAAESEPPSPGLATSGEWRTLGPEPPCESTPLPPKAPGPQRVRGGKSRDSPGAGTSPGSAKRAHGGAVGSLPPRTPTVRARRSAAAVDQAGGPAPNSRKVRCDGQTEVQAVRQGSRPVRLPEEPGNGPDGGWGQQRLPELRPTDAGLCAAAL
jgi:hypothetical protein